MWRIVILIALSVWMIAGCSSGQKQAASRPQLASAALVGAANGLTDVAVDQRGFVGILNAYRRANGLQPVQLDRQLTMAAQDMARRTARARKLRIRAHSQGSLRRRVIATGYPYAASAENLVRGRWTNQEVFDAWRNSPGHNRNMLWPWLTEIGYARTDSAVDGRPYWVLILGLPKSEAHRLPSTPRTPRLAG